MGAIVVTVGDTWMYEWMNTFVFNRLLKKKVKTKNISNRSLNILQITWHFYLVLAFWHVRPESFLRESLLVKKGQSGPNNLEVINQDQIFFRI